MEFINAGEMPSLYIHIHHKQHQINIYDKHCHIHNISISHLNEIMMSHTKIFFKKRGKIAFFSTSTKSKIHKTFLKL